MLCNDNLNVWYDRFQAQFDIDLTVARGERVALIGAEGAGKSRLLHALAGALGCPASGFVQGGGAASSLHDIARGIALVADERHLLHSLTLMENLERAARNGRTGHWTVVRVLRELPLLGAFRHRPSIALPTGLRHVAALACALLNNPSCLLCGELSRYLPPPAVDEVHRVLGAATDEGAAVVLADRDVRRALAWSHRFYCIRHGRAVLEGCSAEADEAHVALACLGVPHGARVPGAAADLSIQLEAAES